MNACVLGPHESLVIIFLQRANYELRVVADTVAEISSKKSELNPRTAKLVADAIAAVGRDGELTLVISEWEVRSASSLRRYGPPYVDETIACVACGGDFLFSANDKIHYDRHAYAPPRRCKGCRLARKQARGETVTARDIPDTHPLEPHDLESQHLDAQSPISDQAETANGLLPEQEQHKTTESR